MLFGVQQYGVTNIGLPAENATSSGTNGGITVRLTLGLICHTIERSA
jgi:hypothetical protein